MGILMGEKAAQEATDLPGFDEERVVAEARGNVGVGDAHSGLGQRQGQILAVARGIQSESNDTTSAGARTRRQASTRLPPPQRAAAS